MPAHLDLYLPALVGAGVVLALWVFLGRQLKQRGRTRWRVVLLCLPLLLAAVGYGLFWFGFFQSPLMAVQLYAIWLTIAHEVAPYLPWIGGVWAALSLYLLKPLLTRAS